MVLVSVIIPVYNKERYLPDAIDSVLKQTYPYFELLVINDNSTDGSRQVCENYCQQDNRVKLFDNLSDEHGPGPARNIGLDQALGDYILFVDADDWIDERLLEQCIQRMKETNADIVQFGVIYQRENGESDVYKWKGKSVVTRNDIIRDFYSFWKNNRYSLWMYLFKRKIIDKTRFDNVISGEDISFVLDILGKVKIIAYIDIPLYFYRYVDSSISRRWNNESIECLYNIWKHKIRFAENLEIGNKDVFTEIAYDTCIWAIFQMCTSVCPLSYDQKKKELKNLMKKINFDIYRRNNNLFGIISIKHFLIKNHLENIMLLLGPMFLKVVRRK